jgi:hypothetical protein
VKEGRVPRRPVLPPQRLSHRGAAAASTAVSDIPHLVSPISWPASVSARAARSHHVQRCRSLRKRAVDAAGL